MSTPQERIQSDLKAAMRARDGERLSTLRMLLSQLENERISSGQAIDDDAFVAVVRRGLKQRRDAAEQYRQGAREELAAKEEREAAILEEYLPRQASEDDIRRAVEEHVVAHDLAGPKAMGPTMKAMLERFGGTADGATVSRLVREVLAARG